MPTIDKKWDMDDGEGTTIYGPDDELPEFLRGNDEVKALDMPDTAEPGNTIVVDFDGVLHSYASGWQGADTIPDDPVQGAVEFITSALDTFHVAVVSARSGQPGGISAMREWMEQHGFSVDHPRLFFPSQKPPALVYIDDRAVPFSGTFPTIEALQNFKPWYADNNSDTPTE